MFQGATATKYKRNLVSSGSHRGKNKCVAITKAIRYLMLVTLQTEGKNSELHIL